MKGFMEISPDVFKKSGSKTDRHTHRQTDAAALYIQIVRRTRHAGHKLEWPQHSESAQRLHVESFQI